MTTKETDQKLHYAETLMALVKETYTNNVDLHCDPDDPCGSTCRDCLIKELGEVATPHLGHDLRQPLLRRATGCVGRSAT